MSFILSIHRHMLVAVCQLLRNISLGMNKWMLNLVRQLRTRDWLLVYGAYSIPMVTVMLVDT